MNDDARIEAEIAQVVSLMRREFPKAADWNALDDGTFEVLDKNDKQLGIITEQKLNGYWNCVESL